MAGFRRDCRALTFKHSDIWNHSQALFAIYRMPGYKNAQREFLPALEIPFASSLEINEPHRRYRWISSPEGGEYDKSTPLLWLAAAQGAALAVPHLLEGNQRETACATTSMFRKFSRNITQPTAAAGICFRRKTILTNIIFTRQR